MKRTTIASSTNIGKHSGFVPLSAPEIRGNEWRYVKECLDTAWVSSVGSYVERFESAFAALVGKRYAIATVNGTASLHVALMVAGVQPGDEVVVSTLTFIAPANAIRYVGAWPVFVDAEPRYWQMDVEKLNHFLDHQCTSRSGALYNKQTGRHVRAILPVDILGHSIDIRPIRELAARYGLTLIEDASESLGAVYRDQRVGYFSDIACFSFNGNKIITTGGGGMIVTDDAEWARRAKHLTTQAKSDPDEYVHDEVGYNYRLTNLQAAMGVAQLEQLETYVGAKRRIADGYARELGGLAGVTVMAEAPWALSTFWMYTVLLDEREFGLDARALMRALRTRHIETRPLWQPLHLSAAHQGAFATDCLVAERLHRDALSLPCSVGLSPSTHAYVIAEIRSAAGSRILDHNTETST